jgi:small-conductance mechanosensitive channel
MTHTWAFLDLLELERLAMSLGLVLAAALAGLGLFRILSVILVRLAQPATHPVAAILVKRLRGPVRLLLPLLAIMMVVPPLAISAPAAEVLKHLSSLCIIAAITWFFMSATLTGQDIALSHFDVQLPDNLKARTVHTELTILVKLLLVAICVVSAATMLMTFDVIRHVGVSLLASAGVVGVILGLAAQRSLATLFAGLQIAFTQPIRMGDVLIVEGEWGWVEEITLTYVVIKIWDLRRLVVPVTYFLEKPFQNWTRASSSLLGTVFLNLDYTVPVERVRQELRVILQASPLWDQKVCGVQITGGTERTLELRLLMSAGDSSRAFDLRCEVREKMLAFLLANFPDCLPRLRADLQGPGPFPARPATGDVELDVKDVL